MGYVKCSAPGCKNLSIRKKQSFFVFPKHPIRCYKWLRFCGLEDKYHSAAAVQSYMRVCSDHFLPNEYNGVEKKKLNSTAVPTIHSNGLVVPEELSKCTILSPTSSPLLASPGLVRNFNVTVLRAHAREAKMQQASSAKDEKVECYENMNIDNAVQNSTQQSTKYIADNLRNDETSTSPQLPLTYSDDYVLDIKVDKDAYTEDFSTEVRLHKMCRLCAHLVHEFELTALFPSDGSQDLVNKINILLPEKVLEGDGLPEHVCNLCIDKLNECDSTVQAFIAAGQKLKSLLQLKSVLPNIQNMELEKNDGKNELKNTQTFVRALGNTRFVLAELTAIKEEESFSDSTDGTLRYKNDSFLNEESIENVSPTTYNTDDSGEGNHTNLIKEEIKSLFEMDNNSQLNWPSQAPVDVKHEVENAVLESEYVCVPSQVTTCVIDNTKTKKRNMEEIEISCDIQDVNNKIKIESSVCETDVKYTGTHPSEAVNYVLVNENETKTVAVKHGTNVPNIIPQVKVYSRRKK